MKIRFIPLGPCVLILTFTSCAAPDASPESADARPALPAGHPAIPEGASADAGTSLVLSGEVLETMDSGGYTYVRLGTEEGEVWVAGPVTPIEVGRRLALADAAAMGSFTSASLQRTFDELYFVGAFVADEPPASGRRGVARQVLSGSGYTYVEVEASQTVSWIAGPQANVREGDVVVWQGGTDMGEFHSPSLGRTFDNILFVERIWVER